MAQHNLFGARGEEIACRYLARRGYRLLARNWRTGHVELDIVADYFGEIVFVEVKARRHEGVHTALEAIDRTKMLHLVEAARAFLRLHHLDARCRFDVITVVGTHEPYTVTHYVSAYTAQQALRRTPPHGADN